MIATNAHGKQYKAENEVRDSTSFKHKNFIVRLISTSSTWSKSRNSSGPGMISHHMLSREENKLDYIYWDDSSELVDRLHLLLASQAAGYPTYKNEIISIIKELREA